MYRDQFTGLYHTHFREYDPLHGRWLSEDPAGYADGLNLYNAYMGVNGTDPLGLAKQPWQWHHYFSQEVFGSGGLIEELGMSIEGVDNLDEFIDQYRILLMQDDHISKNGVHLAGDYNTHWKTWLKDQSLKNKVIKKDELFKELANVRNSFSEYFYRGLNADMPYKDWKGLKYAHNRAAAVRTRINRWFTRLSQPENYATRELFLDKFNAIDQGWKDWDFVNSMTYDYDFKGKVANASIKLKAKRNKQIEKMVAKALKMKKPMTKFPKRPRGFVNTRFLGNSVKAIGAGVALYEMYNDGFTSEGCLDVALSCTVIGNIDLALEVTGVKGIYLDRTGADMTAWELNWTLQHQPRYGGPGADAFGLSDTLNGMHGR